MTLEQWLEQNPRTYHKTFDREAGDNWTFTLLVVDWNDDIPGLYRLDDYRVSSANSGATFHMVRYERASIVG